jgi:molybdenum cofactor guanylyltransferase
LPKVKRERVEAETTENVAGIVLCGGESRRMGQSKAWLPFGPEVLLQRVVRVLSTVVSPVVVVAAQGQELPDLPAEVMIARDEQPALGPLGGLAAGLSALPESIEAVYAAACDAPLLKPEFVVEIIGRLKYHDIAIPRDGKYHHPLAAVYRRSVEAKVRALIAEDRLRPFFLLESSDVYEIDVEDLRRIDPELDSLRNTNTPEDYQAALAVAGLAMEQQ